MRKYAVRMVFWGLFCASLFGETAWAQNYYEIIAVKGRVGILRTPVDRALKIGETYRVVRFREGKLVPVAQVKIALVEKKYSGVKVVNAVAGRQLQRGDLLEIEAESLVEKLQKLEQPWPVESREPIASKSADAGATVAKDGETPPAADPSPPKSPPAKDRAPASILLPPPGLLIAHPNRPLIGPVASMFFPVNFLAEEVNPAASFGVQVTTRLHGNSHLQLSFFYIPQKLTPRLINRLRSQGISQQSYMLHLNAALQQYFARRFFWMVGVGLYRVTNEQTIAGETLQESFNNIGFNAGVGVKLLELQGTRLHIWTQGHLYFPQNSYRTFLTLLASWSVMF